MEVDLVDQPQPLLGLNDSETQASTSTSFDLVGGPFAVIESDPGWSFHILLLLFFNSFTSLLRSFHFIDSSTWYLWPRIG